MSRRVKGTTLHVPIVHGSHAVWLGNKSSETKSHQWWIYLRPLDNVDLSHFIKHVEFTLHDSFEPAKRSKLPFSKLHCIYLVALTFFILLRCAFVANSLFSQRSQKLRIR